MLTYGFNNVQVSMNSMRCHSQGLLRVKGNFSLCSEVYNDMASPSWRRLERQRAVCALVLAFDRAGNSKLAKMAMMAMTTSSSTRVKAGKGGPDY